MISQDAAKVAATLPETDRVKNDGEASHEHDNGVHPLTRIARIEQFLQHHMPEAHAAFFPEGV